MVATLRNSRSFTWETDVPDLEAQVRWRLLGRVSDLHLRIRHGGLVLRGCARSYYCKQLAQHVVMESSELPILANEIVVG